VLTVSGNNQFQVFHVGAGTTVGISGLTVSGGHALFSGGGIYNDGGNLTLTNDAVTDNSAVMNEGGGIYNKGGSTLMLTDDTLANNTAGDQGGGLFNSSFPTPATATLTNVTLANNTAVHGGGGILNSGSLTLSNDTLTNNSPGTNGGGILTNGTLALYDTIVAGNVGVDVYRNSGTVTSNGFNLYGTSHNVTWQGSDIQTSNPVLGSLQPNGGPTETVALLPGSPAIGAGSSVGAPATDQRGVARPSGAIDIGAFESRGFTLAISGGNNQTAKAGTSFATPLQVTVTSAFGEPVQGGVVTFTGPNSGAGLTPVVNTATISAGGTASLTATANGVVGGPYTVITSASGGNSVNFSLTNGPVDNVGVFRPGTNGIWFLNEVQGDYNQNTTLQINNFGTTGDVAVSGDWLGNGLSYVGVFRPSTGTWYLSTTNTTYSTSNTIVIGNFGHSGDIPVVGHWGQNPNIDYVGVFRPSTGQWFLDTIQGSYGTGANTIEIDNFGKAGDQPVVGNWGNSTITDSRSYVGVFRPPTTPGGTGTWYLDEVEGTYNKNTTLEIDNFGATGDTAVVGNWLGGAQDGHAYVGVFRPGPVGGTATWFLSKTNTTYSKANTIEIDNFGTNGDIAQVGDWLGTGLTEVGVFRPGPVGGTASWYLSKTNTTYSMANTIPISNFGTNGDQPVVGAWAIPGPELLDGLPGSNTTAVTSAELQTIVSAAIARWEAAGLDSAGVALLNNLQISIGDLPTGWLGAYVSGSIVIDPTADGDDWFVDPTAQPTPDHVDALTVVMHEMGHALGLPDEAMGVMSESLAVGTRNLPTAADVAAAFASGLV
jgi:hypothetical protein